MSTTMQSQLPSQQRPRSKSTFSFRSNKGDTNDLGAKPKIDMKDAKRTEKKSRFGGNKKDPNAAVTEMQPAMFAQSEPSTLVDLKGQQWKDSMGNDIADPDATNPTRPRMERPLDTIRSFEAAYDNSYKRRTQMIRAESADALSSMLPNGASRRSSIYLGNGGEAPFAPQPRYSPNHLGSHSRHMSMRSGYDGYGYQNHNGFNGYNTSPQSGYMSRRPSGLRQHSAPYSQHRMSADYSHYQPPHNYHESESRDTVNTGESSGSASEQYGNSTDPSSENSSIDRVHAVNAKNLQQMNMDPIEAAQNYPYGRGNDRASPMPMNNNPRPIRNTAIREEEDGRSLRAGYGGFDPYQPRRRSPPQSGPQYSQQQFQQQQQQQSQQFPSIQQQQPQPQPQRQQSLRQQPQAPPERKIIRFDANPALSQEYAPENAAMMAASKASKGGKPAPPAAAGSGKRKSWFGRKK